MDAKVTRLSARGETCVLGSAMVRVHHFRPAPVINSAGITPAVVAGGVSIGPVRFGELRRVARLQRRAFRRPLAYGYFTLLALNLLPNVWFLVAREGEEIVGCAIGDRRDNEGRVINLCVDPATRRRGIGRALLQALEAALPSGDVILMVETTNEGARHLYLSEGYAPVGTAKDYYGRGHDGIWMRKKGDDTTATDKVWC